MSMFEGLPPRFRGEDSDIDPADIWLKKVKLVSELKEWKPDIFLSVFKLWLEGKAAKWLEKTISKYGSSLEMSTLEKDFLLEFKTTKNKESGNLITLSQYTPKPKETISSFNDRFTDYLHTIPTKFYTKEWVSESYLSSISRVDRDIWWKLIQVESKPDYLELMKETEKLFRLKIQAQNLSPVSPTSAGSTSPSVPTSFPAPDVFSAKLNSTSTTSSSIDDQPSNYIKEKNTVSDSKNENIQAQIASLTDSMNKLTLLVQNSQRKDYSQVVCQNCGRTGHPTFRCRVSKPKPNHSPEEKNSLLALSEERSHDTEDEMETVMTSERMQVDSLLNPIQYQQPGFYNNPYSTNLYPPPSGPNPSVELSPHLPPINQRMGINEKKKKKLVKTKPRTTFPSRVLESNVPITIKEFLKIRPNLVDELVMGLRQLKKEKGPKPVLLSSEKSSELDQPPSYILVSINGKSIPALIDTGATQSIMDSNLVRKIGVPMQKLENSITLKSVNGQLIQVSYGVLVNLQFEEDLKVPVKFIVITNGAQPLLIGMDVLMALKTVINYDQNNYL
ncbi:hypothetical protein BB559_005359 [Furculomyces boomerangus]|uniref:Peptidase A2 domain-containing protein n=1 Tax=Furculomyces boomerangus TaxID=61424 RepID=A0A2T9Y947_9FUNG|nr:hypothetical protein BB559_005359 [Furculomyces boomerangus]